MPYRCSSLHVLIPHRATSPPTSLLSLEALSARPPTLTLHVPSAPPAPHRCSAAATLQVEMLGLPGIVINRLPGSQPGQALYVDVFDGGKVMDAAQAQVFAMSMGLPPYSTEMGALAPANVSRWRQR
jgi:hypothetical protein